MVITHNVRNQSLEKYKTGTEQHAYKRSGGMKEWPSSVDWSQLPCARKSVEN